MAKFILDKEMVANQEFDSLMVSVDGRRLWVTYYNEKCYFKVENLLGGKGAIYTTSSLNKAIEKFNQIQRTIGE